MRLFLIPFLLISTISHAEPRVLRVQQARSQHGMVVSESPYASRAGRDVLERGGNAVDAAVATALALAVTWPEAGNIGGGGFMMVHPGDNSAPVCVEYRETAPASATKTMFSKDDGRYTHKIVGVPGTVKGLALAHEKYGRLPWKELVMPAVRLADHGIEVDQHLADSINRVFERLGDDDSSRFNELRRIFGHPNSRPWRANDRLIQKDLAKTLKRIASLGPDGFYNGKVAKLIVAEMKRGDGRVTMDDLASYKANVRKPIHGTFRGYDIYGPPPPSSGGICLVQMLNILEGFDLRRHDRWSARNVHVIVESMRQAFCDRARHLGDADFISIPEHLTDKKYAKQLADDLNLSRATPSEKIAPDIPLADESPSTTHFSVIDANGMAVSNTYTLEASWGSRIVVRGAGFLLNNEMGDFNWIPGETNRQGRIGTKPNQIQPRKRMLSSQTPTIVTRDGGVVLLTGSPGGRTIINTVLNVVLNVLEFEMDLPTAIEAPRMHHGWFPDRIYFEGVDEAEQQDTIKKLGEMNHKVGKRSSQGSAHSIYVEASGKYLGVADFRRGGLAAGANASGG